MINYLINSFKRKIARRVTKQYGTRIDTFNVPGVGNIKLANWENPLVEPKDISLKTINFFKQFLKPGDMAIDIGANVGLNTIPMALAAGKNGMILAFDPNPYVFQVLSENAKLNPELTNIHAFNYAISETDDEFFYNSSEASFNNGGISKEKESKHGKYSLSTKIKGIQLESFLAKSYAEKLGKLKMIKIDTEGYDKEIIKSISNILNKHKPVVISECFVKTTPAERYEHFELLKSKGYALYYFSDFDVAAKKIPILKKEDMLNWDHFDLYAIME